MACCMACCIIFPSILAPKNRKKILILAKFWTPQTKILASLDKVCSTRAKLFYVACKINRASQYRIDRYGPMLLTQADNGYPLRQSSRIPNFQRERRGDAPQSCHPERSAVGREVTSA